MRALLGKLGLACASTVVLLAVAELALRLAGYGALEVYEPDPELFWRLRPGQVCRTKVGGYPVHVNAQGYRGGPLAARKDPDTARVVVFGDSATYGWGVRDDETFAAQLARRLGDAGVSAEVVNGGVNAYALFQEEIAFGRARTLEPDAAVFAFSFNESWQDLQWIDGPRRERVLRGVEWKNWLRRSALYHAVGEIQLRFVYDRLRQQLTSDVHGGRPRTDGERLTRYRETLGRIAARARATGVPVAFVVLPVRGRPEPDPYQEAMLAFARERGIPVLDLTAGPDLSPDAWFLPDDTVHPSPAGHADVARRLEPIVRTLLTAHHADAAPRLSSRR